MGDLGMRTEEVTKSWKHYEDEKRNLLQDNVTTKIKASGNAKVTSIGVLASGSNNININNFTF
jgi:hypothetical protein